MLSIWEGVPPAPTPSDSIYGNFHTLTPDYILPDNKRLKRLTALFSHITRPSLRMHCSLWETVRVVKGIYLH